MAVALSVGYKPAMQNLILRIRAFVPVLLLLAFYAEMSFASCELFLFPRPAELDPIFDQIRETAHELKGLPDFISPRSWRARTATYGLPGLDLPVEVGGRGWNAQQMVSVFEFAGRFSLNMRDVVGGAHARPLLRSQNLEVRSWLSQVSKGEAYFAIALTEEGVGSDFRSMQTRATKVPGGYELTGEKLFNARLENGTHVLLFTRAASGRGLTAFALPLNHPGLKIKSLGAAGLKGNSFGGLSLDKVFVPMRYRIGKDGEGASIFGEHFMYWRLMMASAAIGTGKEALSLASKRLKEREAFGGPIGRFTHLQQPLAELTAKLTMASLLVHKAAELLDNGQQETAAPLVSMAKAEAVEWALEAADYAMKVFGAEGYSDRTDLAERVADLMGLRIADGPTDVLRQDVIRKVYGSDLWEMAIR